MSGIPVRVRSVDGRSIFRLFGKPADGRLTGVCEISVVCDYDTCRTSQQAAYYRPFDEHSLDSELGAAEKPCGHSAGDGTETEANDEVAQAKRSVFLLLRLMEEIFFKASRLICRIECAPLI